MKRLIMYALCVFPILGFAAHPFKIEFSAACQSGKHLRIAAVGDVLLHAPLQIQSAASGYDKMWKVALPYIQNADISYANLEGAMAEGVNKSGRLVADPGQIYDNKVYSSFPLFNYHPSLGLALKQSGFDIVSTANNHTLDRYSIGIDKTISGLEQAKLKHVGTRVKNTKVSWAKIINKNGFKIAWIACTENTNGINDKYNQVLYCYKKQDRQYIMQTINQLKDQVDIVIVAPHWGEQYQHHENRAQKAFAHQALEAGATAIIGSHPHVLQSMEKYQTKDGRETFIIYSLGNFVSYQGTPKNRTTIVLILDFLKNKNKTEIAAMYYFPMYMQNRQGIHKIRLTPVKKSENTIANTIIKNNLPEGNAIYSLDELDSNKCDRSL